VIAELAQRGYEFNEGAHVLSDMLKPYPWWYWTLVVVCNFPVYWLLIYAVFFSREKFRFYCEFLYKHRESQAGSGYALGMVFASFRVGLWFALCIGVVIAQHHLLWKGLFESPGR